MSLPKDGDCLSIPPPTPRIEGRAFVKMNSRRSKIEKKVSVPTDQKRVLGFRRLTGAIFQESTRSTIGSSSSGPFGTVGRLKFFG
jgi:hypothetical protein